MTLRGRVVLAGLALSCTAVAGCGGSSAPTATPATMDATPAAAPSGTSAQAVSYRCVSGRQDTITVTLPDPRRLADVLNPINVCEYDGGLAEVTLLAACTEGGPGTERRIAAVDGKLPASTAGTICG